MSVRIQLRRDTAANWASTNPTLTQGEPGYETDTGKIKYGDGSTAWNSLAYAAGEAFAAGSASAPSITFSADPNTGIYSPGADQLAISSNSSERIRIGANGEIGIGGANYGTSGQVLTSGGSGAAPSWTTLTVNTDKIEEGNSSAEVIDTGSDGRFVVTTEGSERLRVDSSGRLGLGTSAPGALLNLAGTNTASARNVVLRFNDTDSTVADGDIAGAIEFYSNDGGTSAETLILEARYNGTGGSSDLFIRTGDKGSLSDDFVFTNGGRLGIGTTSPSVLLDCQGTGTQFIRVRTSDASGSAVGVLRAEYLGGGGGTYTNVELRAGSAYSYLLSTTDAPLLFGINGTERARIDGSGRLLVGTSTARSMGGITAGIFIEGTAYNSLSINNNTNDAFSSLLAFGKSRGTANGAVTIVSSGDRLGGINFYGADGSTNVEAARIAAEVDGTPGANDMPGRLVFSTTADGASSPTARATIDSSGRLLIGTSSASTPDALFELYKGSGSIFGYIRSNSLPNNQQAAITVYGQSRTQAYGIYKHSGIANPCGYLGLTAEDDGANFLWTDNSDILRISTIANHIGTTSGTVVGTQTSDERIKNILGPVEYGLDTLKQIEPVRFSLKSEPETEKLGFIAQQVQPLVPESVFDTNETIEGEPEDAPTKLGMEYVALIPVLVNAIKELSAEVDALKAQLQAQ